ncbi:MAG: hypothetical protein O3C26_04295 [Actinomycetota bacterium]|nr:hypothetical protein [Actinomycetota bacterium]
MKIEVNKPRVPYPCFTPFGVIDKNFTASAKLNKGDDFSVEYEVEVVTSEIAGNQSSGIFIKRLTIIADPNSRMGVTSTQLREVQVRALLEATIHRAIYAGTQRKQLAKFSNVANVTPKQKRAAQIIMDNPGESHANLLMDEFGITEGSARNLKTRVLKLGLIPNSNVDSEPASFPQMSAEGDYIQQVLEGKIKEPLPPSEWFALQEKKKTKRKVQNGKKKK